MIQLPLLQRLAPFALVAAVLVLTSCMRLPRPANIVAPPMRSATPTAWNEDLWIIAKREPSAAAANEPEVPKFPSLQTRSSEARAPVSLPPRSTDVHAAVAGDVAAVSFRQQYVNPFAEPIDVEYVFPLPEDAAVSDFVMTVGTRRIRGIVRERREAERLYAEAKQAGRVAALLTQERPNVFAQAVANLEPGRAIDVDLTYFHTLAYRDGEYELLFRLAVPAHSDVALSVDIDAGLPIATVHSPSHAVDVRRPSEHSVHVELSRRAPIANGDFVLRFGTAGNRLQAGWIGHRDERGGFFALTLRPPADPQGKEGPALREVEVDWGSLQVSDVHPASIPDVSSGPVVLRGRFRGSEPATIKVTGRAAGRRHSYALAVGSADLNASHPVLATIWARQHIAALEREGGADESQRIEQITHTALEYGLMSAYTTFLVVDAKAGATLPPAGR